MTLTQVQYVLAVAGCGSFSRAAQDQFISQPALSRQIHNLEAELGRDLFLRSPQGVTLTSDGEEFCQQAQKVADAWDAFQRSVFRDAQPAVRHLRIGMSSRVFSNLLFESIVQFFDSHPEFEVTFVTEAGQDFINGLQSGTLDLALDRLPNEDFASGQSSFAAYDLIREPQCVLMSPNDPRRTLPGITFAELQGCTMMTGLENSMEDRLVREMCRLHKITLKRLYRTDSMDTVMGLVRSGKGVILGPLSFADYYGVAAVPLSPELDVDLKFICLRRSSSRPDIVLFRRYMTELCRGRKSGPVAKREG